MTFLVVIDHRELANSSIIYFRQVGLGVEQFSNTKSREYPSANGEDSGLNKEWQRKQ
tara:strand:+ start:2428 stop:2598 length:171 start_codon:yes stop_codon:yes gene_type:complete